MINTTLYEQKIMIYFIYHKVYSVLSLSIKTKIKNKGGGEGGYLFVLQEQFTRFRRLFISIRMLYNFLDFKFQSTKKTGVTN